MLRNYYLPITYLNIEKIIYNKLDISNENVKTLLTYFVRTNSYNMHLIKTNYNFIQIYLNS